MPKITIKERRQGVPADTMKTSIASLLATLACFHAASARGLFNPHIVGGEIAVPHSYPHMVMLLDKDDGWFCAGSIVSDRWVLTAAHCCTRDVRYIRAGGHKWKEFEPSVVVVPVDSKHLYEGFTQDPYRGDICLVHMEKSLAPQIAEGKFINTIRLPKKSDASKVYWGSKVTMTGWGRVINKHSNTSPELKVLNTTVDSADVCKTYIILDDNYDDVDQMCTSGKGGVGPCFGDSGGPLTQIEDDGEHTLIGVASYLSSSYSCENGEGSAWTRVASFLDWVEEISEHEVPIRP